MAKQKNNLIMRNTRGMVGKQIVFKSRAGRTYVSAPPDVNESRVPTPAQLTGREKFKAASAYARLAISDRDTKELYNLAARRGQTAFNVAFKDAYIAPHIVQLIVNGYLGQVGNLIVVHAKDDFKVNAVKVSIFNSANELIEEGAASPSNDGLLWTYSVTQPNASIAGTKIQATAFDMPENEGSLAVTL